MKALLRIAIAFAAFVQLAQAQRNKPHQPTLTGSNAIRALQDLCAQRKPDDLSAYIAPLRDAQKSQLNQEDIRVGPWYINVKEKLFSLQLGIPPHMISYSGSFLFQDKHWVATIKKKQQT